MGKEKLMAAVGSYRDSASGVPAVGSMQTPNAGFSLPPGLNVHNLGPALPINTDADHSDAEDGVSDSSAEGATE